MGLMDDIQAHAGDGDADHASYAANISETPTQEHLDAYTAAGGNTSILSDISYCCCCCCP